MEYNHAVSLNKPRLIFFIHKDHPVVIDDVETGSGAVKLNALKERISEARVTAFFKSPGDLRAHVVEALTRLSKELDTTHPPNTTVSGAARLDRETLIPPPPEPYIAHPYTLLQLHDLIGRQTELNALTDWASNPTAAAFSARVFCFVAIGGMGKSALTWKWFHQIVPNEMGLLDGSMWWSFYESEASLENFLTCALCYLSGLSEDAVRRLSWQDRESQLLWHLNNNRYLFVLDGLERILIAYNRMDASYLADNDYDQRTANSVVGAIGLPPSSAQPFIGPHHLRQTTDPRGGRLLQKLAQVENSKILITTRLYPSALQTSTGQAYPGCFPYFLMGLHEDDALRLWRALGVKGSRAELGPIFRSIEGHPLLVQALASEIANYRQAPGNFGRWWLDHPHFDPTSLPVVQSRTHVLEFALNGLSSQIREVLHTLVGFRMPVSYATLEALLVGRRKSWGSARALDEALTELEDRGLIGWDRAANRYDAHPLVRGVVWQSTNAGARRAIYTALAAHFQPMAVPEWEKVESLADLTPAIEAYHTLVGLGRYDDAFILFRDRLSRATLHRLAAYGERIAWLEQLFPAGTSGSPALTNERDQAYILNELAQSYLFCGRPGRSVPLFRRADKLDASWNFSVNSRQIGLSNLGFALSQTGALREAIGALRRALTLNRHSGESGEAIILNYLGRVLGLTGASFLAHVALARSERMRMIHSQDRSAVSAYFAELALWLGDLVEADYWAERAWKHAGKHRHERDLIRSALIQGQVALGIGSLLRADERLHYALTHAREVNLMEFELSTLIAIAEFKLQSGHPTEAKAQLNDVWEDAEEGPYPLHQADAFNAMTAIALADGNNLEAIAAATNAFRAAWCDGPPYAYHWGLEKAKAHLVALNAPQPNLSPYDENKFEPTPLVRINPRDRYWVNSDHLVSAPPTKSEHSVSDFLHNF
jgi:tetratricopeptide (TPR) repeat protein